MPAPAKAKETPIEALPLEERIRRRAYELYVERGNQSGSELDDWLTGRRRGASNPGPTMACSPRWNSRRMNWALEPATLRFRGCYSTFNVRMLQPTQGSVSDPFYRAVR